MPEVIVARHCGIRVFGISIITDLGVEGKIVEVSHEEVQKAANAVQPLMADIFRALIQMKNTILFDSFSDVRERMSYRIR